MQRQFQSLKFTPPEPYFGVDVDGQMQKWWSEEYLPSLPAKYGNGSEVDVAVVVLLDDGSHYFVNPFGNILHVLTAGDIEQDLYSGPVGLLRNVAGKLRFTLRTGERSSCANDRPDLQLSGDFPAGGAGLYMRYIVGASGLTPEQDWDMGRDVVDQLIVFRAAAAEVADAASKARTADSPPEVKYLGADPAFPVGRPYMQVVQPH